MVGTKIATTFGPVIARFMDIRSGTPTIMLDSCPGEFFVSGIGVTAMLLVADYGKGFVNRRESGRSALTVQPRTQPEVRKRIRKGLADAVNAWSKTDSYRAAYDEVLESA